MAIISNLKHYKDMMWLFYKYGHSNLLDDFHTQLSMPQIIKEKGEDRGKPEDLVKDLEELGPFYIKLGQILSSGIQLLPPQYDEALQKLQDKARPMPYSQVKKIIFEEFHQYPEDLFTSFEKTPLAAASLGQVHVAKLGSKKLAVKVQRNIQDEILEQLEALNNLIDFLQKKTEWGEKYQIAEKFESMKNIFLNELNYNKEANNLKTLNENLKEFKNIIVPLPLDEYTTPRVLTMEFIKGEKITSLDIQEKQRINRKKLANELFGSFLKQIFTDGFFQMDPHPGNIFLTQSSKGHKPLIALLDLGMVAQISFQMQGQLIRAIFALSENREYEIVKILISLGKKTSSFDEYLFRTKISSIMGSYRGLQTSEISIGRMILQLHYEAAETGLWLPTQFSMIGKALLSLSPVLNALDPEFSIQQNIQTNASDLLKERIKQQLSYQSLYGNLLEGVEFLEHLPGRLNEFLDLITHNDYQLKVRFLESSAIAKNFEKIANRITTGLILAALVIAAALLARNEKSFKIFGFSIPLAFFLLATTGALFLIISVLWNDRKKDDKQ